MMSHGDGAPLTPSPHFASAVVKAVVCPLLQALPAAGCAGSQQIWLGANVAEARPIVPPPEAGHGLMPVTPGSACMLHVIAAPVGTAARLVEPSFWSPNSAKKVARTQ